MDYNNLLYEIEDSVLTITINRPKTYNALSEATKKELIDAFKRADNDEKVKAIIFTGAGDKAFCAGQDLNESQDESEETAKSWLGGYDDIYKAIRSVNKPIVSSINGYATGAGLQLALLTDIRISNETAKYGMTEINVGLACITGTALLWDLMGQGRTVDMVLTGRMLTAQEAEKYGLVTRVVPNTQLKDKSTELAKALAEQPPVAVANTKDWIRQLSEEKLSAGMSFGEVAHTRGFASGEPQQKMKEFFERRRRKKSKTR